MSYIARIPPPEPEPERFQRIVLEELADVFAILEQLSTRLARLEGDRPADRSQTRRETP